MCCRTAGRPRPIQLPQGAAQARSTLDVDHGVCDQMSRADSTYMCKWSPVELHVAPTTRLHQSLLGRRGRPHAQLDYDERACPGKLSMSTRGRTATRRASINGGDCDDDLDLNARAALAWTGCAPSSWPSSPPATRACLLVRGQSVRLSVTAVVAQAKNTI